MRLLICLCYTELHYSSAECSCGSDSRERKIPRVLVEQKGSHEVEQKGSHEVEQSHDQRPFNFIQDDEPDQDGFYTFSVGAVGGSYYM